MKRSMIFGIAALIMMAFCTTAFAVGDVTEIIKWVQPPDYQTGLDLQSQWDSTDYEPDLIKADDWICPDGRPITDIHWWGSYFNNDSFSPDGFYINIYTNNDMGTPPSPADDVPGADLWNLRVNMAAVNQVSTGVFDSVGEEVYYYSVYLPEDFWFSQERGQRYWLSIVADTPNIGDIPVWGWHTGFEPQVCGLSTAVTGKVLTGDGMARGNPDQWEHMTYNMAFSLTTIPEPGTMAMLGLGALGLLTFRRKRK